MAAFAFALIVSLVAAPPSLANPAAATSTTAPAPASGEAAQLIERACKQYATASSYEDTLALSSEVDAAQPLQLPEDSETTLAFVRPNKLALATPHYSIVSDGHNLFERMDVWMQYHQAAAPAVLHLKDISLSNFAFFREDRHPLLPILLENDRSSFDALNGEARPTTVTADVLDGAPGKRVSGIMGPYDGIAVEVWFDDASGLIGEVIYDHTRDVQKKAPALQVKKIVQRFRFKKVRINQPIGAERFTFTPGLYVEKVSAFAMPDSRAMQQRLVGKPAFAFTGEYLDGKKVSLDTYKGRVVLLDFWSLRCAPCLYSMPTLQKVADRYADKPVSIVGVNLDGASASQNVSQMLTQRKISFSQMISTKPKLAEKFFVEGIPCAVLIDAKGTIQSIHLGMADERDLTSQIDRLLKGENLFGK